MYMCTNNTFLILPSGFNKQSSMKSFIVLVYDTSRVTVDAKGDTSFLAKKDYYCKHIISIDMRTEPGKNIENRYT